ncbi:MAG: MarR family transcriptional regulator [archaeon]
MKPTVTQDNLRRRYKAIMWICILFGGFMIILFALDLYTVIWSGSSILSGQNIPRDGNRIINSTNFDLNHPAPIPRQEFNPLRIITSPFSILLLISGIIMLLSGHTIWRITREKEIKKIREDAADQFLLPDEKKVIDALKAHEYSLTQSQLVKNTGMNKVQVHRTIKRLEVKELIEKHEYGLTNKIVLKKEFFD